MNSRSLFLVKQLGVIEWNYQVCFKTEDGNFSHHTLVNWEAVDHNEKQMLEAFRTLKSKWTNSWEIQFRTIIKKKIPLLYQEAISGILDPQFTVNLQKVQNIFNNIFNLHYFYVLSWVVFLPWEITQGASIVAWNSFVGSIYQWWATPFLKIINNSVSLICFLFLFFPIFSWEELK